MSTSSPFSPYNVGEINNNKKVYPRVYQSRWSWNNIKYKIFPVEVLYIIFVFLVMFLPNVYRQVYFQRLAKEALSNVSDYTAPNTSTCLKQDIIVNYTSNSTFESIQMAANHLNMYSEVIQLSFGSVTALLYGPLSDTIGRKPIFLFVFIGLLLATLMQVFVIVFELNLYVSLVSVAFYGLGGGYATMTGVVFAAVTDITPKRWRTIRMGVVESCVAIGTILNFLIGFNWFQEDNCNFFPPALLLVSMSVLGLLYWIVLPESLCSIGTDNEQQTTDCNTKQSSSSKFHGFKKLSNSAKLFLVPSYSGFSNWWRIWFISLVICLTALCEVGSNEIITYFLYNKPLEWSYTFIGYFGAYTNGLDALILLVILPILLAIGLSNYIILLLGVIIPAVSNAVIANVKKTWQMFVAGGFRSTRDIAFPVLRAMLADHVSPQLYGSVLTISSSLETMCESGSSILFNEIYHPESVVNGHKINAGIIFWISAGVWASSIPFILFLWFFKPKNVPKQPSVQLVTEKTLLSSDTNENYGATQ